MLVAGLWKNRARRGQQVPIATIVDREQREAEIIGEAAVAEEQEQAQVVQNQPQRVLPGPPEPQRLPAQVQERVVAQSPPELRLNFEEDDPVSDRRSRGASVTSVSSAPTTPPSLRLVQSVRGATTTTSGVTANNLNLLPSPVVENDRTSTIVQPPSGQVSPAAAPTTFSPESPLGYDTLLPPIDWE